MGKPEYYYYLTKPDKYNIEEPYIFNKELQELTQDTWSYNNLANAQIDDCLLIKVGNDTRNKKNRIDKAGNVVNKCTNGIYAMCKITGIDESRKTVSFKVLQNFFNNPITDKELLKQMNGQNSGLFSLDNDFIQTFNNRLSELNRQGGYPMKQSPLNQILYGPPGTGKTYNSIIHALSIIDGEDVNALNKQGNTEDGRAELKKRFDNYVKLGQIILTTFHQSYGYEEFVEGIKALEPQSEKNPSEQLIYKTMPGVFKKLCEEARKITYKTNNIEIDSNSAVWKISLGGAGNFHDVKKQCFADNEIRIGWGQVKQLDDEEFSKLETKTQNTITSFMETMTKGDIVLSLHSATEIDGIGIIEGDYERDENSNKEYPHKRKVKWLIKEKPTGILSLNQKTRLVQQTVYRLWRINPAELVSIMPTNEYKIEENNSSKKYILIIDEINRGNISKIFGELITLIEESKRLGKPEELKAKLPYSGEEFGVPQNLYIIGTMNTADRSIALMDTALRRRFEFVEMMPKADKLKDINIQKDGTIINLQILLETINERIEYLYDRDHQIGHAYFIGISSFEELQGVFKNKIIPLLQEYFYDDWEKIDLTLGGNGFIAFKTVDATLFNGKSHDLIDSDKKIFWLDRDALGKAENYAKIYQNTKGAQNANNQP